MKRIYVVGEIGWEYNDETYYRSHYNQSIPKGAFTHLSEAEDYCDRKNLEFLRSINLEYYGYHVDEIFSDLDKASELCGKYGISLDDAFRDGCLLQQLTDDQIRELMPYLEVKLYEVTEVQLVEETDHGDMVG